MFSNSNLEQLVINTFPIFLHTSVNPQQLENRPGSA